MPGIFISPSAPAFPDINYVEAAVISATKHPLLGSYVFTAIGTANALSDEYSYRVQIEVTGAGLPDITAYLYKTYVDEKETIYAEIDKRIEAYVEEALGGDY